MNTQNDYAHSVPFMSASVPLQSRLHWTLRIALAACFIGHGAFGIITKPAWLPYFALVSIDHESAYALMPLVGMMDISLGVWILLKPVRAPILYMMVWAVWTALLRPLSGEGWWEFMERAGNYGIPLALLAMSGFPKNGKEWFQRIREPVLTDNRLKQVAWILRITTAVLLVGHGGFGAFMQKEMLIDHFHHVGLPPFGMDARLFLVLTGWFEIGLGLFVLIRPVKPVLVLILFWKIWTELLYPVSGTPVWEFVERFGSYAAPLSLYFILDTGKPAGYFFPEKTGARR